jgi:hypothetical protein
MRWVNRSCFLCLSSPISVRLPTVRLPAGPSYTHTHALSLSLFFFRFGYLISIYVSSRVYVSQISVSLSYLNATSLPRSLSFSTQQ